MELAPDMVMSLVYTIVAAIFDPIFFIIIYITYVFYKKHTQLEKHMLPFIQKSAQNKVIDAVLHGIIIGILGSLIMKTVGLPLKITKSSILILPIALLLSLKNPRFACFSYGAAALGGVGILIPSLKLDIPGIVSLVGTLHLMEAVLIYITGSKDSMPIMIKLKGRYLGAYVMQKYWPIPLALFTIGQGFAPMCGILGYGSIAITSTPENKSKKMGIYIGIYAIAMLYSARIVHKYGHYNLIILFLMAFLHEIIYYLDHYFENNKEPIYTTPPKGIRVLDVLKNSPGGEMGIKRGDVILRINNEEIEDIPHYYRILKQGHHMLQIHILRMNGKKEVLKYNSYKKMIIELGIAPLPRYSIVTYRIK